MTMTGDDPSFSPTKPALSLKSDLHITVEEGSENHQDFLVDEKNELGNDCEDLFGIEGSELESEGDDTSDQFLEIDSNEDENDGAELNDQLFQIEGNENEMSRNDDIDVQNSGSQQEDYPQPVVGLEFDSYDDAYNYYNLYAKKLGFAIRVKSSWTKRNSKEKRGAVLCCNCEGFKTVKEANNRKKETRTGCLAMIRLRLVESNRWRVDEVKLEHNHIFDHERAQNSKSHKKLDPGAKRKREPTLDVEVHTIKLYWAPGTDVVGYGSSNSYEGESNNYTAVFKRLKLKQGDARAIYKYVSQVQLTDPNFFYVYDLSDEGTLRNVFWIDSRSRAAYSYFGDVIAFDSTCLLKNHEIPLVSFVGVNHHGHTILFGCGLLADETLETYMWLFRAWLTCMSGRPPQTIITNQCNAIHSAVMEVFPRAHHRLCTSHVVQSILESMEALENYEAFQVILSRTVYDSLKVDEFESGWEDMIQRFAIRNHEYLQSLYEDRERWAPAYTKDTCFSGMPDFQNGESTRPFFDGHIHHKTSFEEFFKVYEIILKNKREEEACNDLESKDFKPILRTRCYYELQLSKFYTKDVFMKFQLEVSMMSSCFSIAQVHTNGPIVTYLVQEREVEENLRGIRNFEVMYDKAGAEVRCMCSCFNLNGYLCRHALSILNYNGVEEIPFRYIFSRWSKDFKRLYIPDLGCNNVDITNPLQCFDHLYRKAMQVVQEGMVSQDHYSACWQAFKESLNKVRLVADKQINKQEHWREGCISFMKYWKEDCRGIQREGSLPVTVRSGSTY